jgi:cell division protein FtsB
LRASQSQLRSARDGLAKTEAAMANVTAELVLPAVPTDRRAFLATELVRLTQQRTELVARIDQLTLRTQELAADMHELERQSPYAL